MSFGQFAEKPRLRQFVQHVRHPLNESQYIGTVAVIEKSNGAIGTGWSQCHPSDQFNKKEGANKALGRARANFPLKDKDGNTLKPVAFITYNPDGSKNRLQPIKRALAELIVRAERLINNVQETIESAVCEGRR